MTGAITAADVIAVATEAFGVTKEHLLDHDKRDQDVMDARAMVVYILRERLEYSSARATRLVGYTQTPSNLKNSCSRLLRRVEGSARLRRQIALFWPQQRAA